jgi:hypothetical protein
VSLYQNVWRSRFRLCVRETLPVGSLQGAGYGAGGVDRTTVAAIVTVLRDDVASGLAEANFSKRIGLRFPGAFVQCSPPKIAQRPQYVED